MKTLIISFAVLVFSFVSYAQQENENQLRPLKNNFSLELDFIPFSQNSPINLNAFRGRFFFNENIALRVGFNYRHKKNQYEEPASVPDDVMLFDEISEKYNIYGISAGIEFHPLKSKRISPYFGLDINYETKSSSATFKEYSYEYVYPDNYIYKLHTTEIENAWREIIYYDPYNIMYSYFERAYNSFGINAVIGVDVYIIKHLYMGFELGLGYNSITYKDVEIKADNIIDKKFPKSKENNSGLNVNNAIRLGFWF